jgi:hypothetical protein
VCRFFDRPGRAIPRGGEWVHALRPEDIGIHDGVKVSMALFSVCAESGSGGVFVE